MMSAVIDSMAAFLSSAPDPLLAAGRVGDRLPSTASDVPAIALSLVIESTRGTGMSRYLREGNQLVQNTSIIDVSVTPTTFTSDLKTLRVPALPIRKNPASPAGNFTGNDVSVTRVTGAGQPVTYRYVDRPAAVSEFAADAIRGLIVFGAAQPAGEKLQVVYWTVAFRDDVRGDHCNGLITLELWAGSAADASALSRKLQTRLFDRPGLRQYGFSALLPAGLTPTQSSNYQPASGSPFAVWNQALTYKFHYEAEQPTEASSGGPILKVNVDMDDELRETFSVPGGN